MSLSPALLAGRYRLVDPLGSGGMGRVWLARDEVLHRDVAIKEVNLPLDLNPADREELRVRTLREARTSARLSHPNVVQIYDVLGIEDRPWIVMEYVPSRSLQQIIANEGTIPPREAAEIGLAVLGALIAAHRAGVLHRDVKPGNVLIAENGRVVLTDFGLATFDGGEASVTRPGLVWGSPEYVAPERAKHGVSSVEADLWSLGATLFAAVEGHSPYARTTAMGSLTALATEKPPAPQHAGPLKSVLTGLLRKDPRARLRPTEVERMLRRVAEPDDRPRPAKVAGGRRPPRQRGATPPTDGSAAVPIASYSLPEPPTEVFTRPVPATGPAQRRIGRRGWLVAVALVALLAAVGGIAIYEAGNPKRMSPGRTPSTIFAAPATSASHRAMVAAGDLQPGEPALPAGWGYHREAGKFRVGAPVGWLITYEGAVVRFQEPDTARRLAVEVAAAPAPKPMDAVLAKDRSWSAGGGPLNYQRKRLDAVAVGDEGVEWEYMYDDPQYGPMQVICRRFNSGGRGFAISWTTRQYDFGTSRGFYDLALGSFRPL